MKRLVPILCLAIFVFGLSACGNDIKTSYENSSIQTQEIAVFQSIESVDSSSAEDAQTAKSSEMNGEIEMIDKIYVTVGDYTFNATLEDNDAVRELVLMLQDAPIVLQLDDYSGFEKVGALGKNLTRSDMQTTTKSGDIVLYNGNNIVIFYGSNSWSYTRLGKIDDLTNWKESLGKGSVTVTLSLAPQ